MATKANQSVIVITKGKDRDIFADLGEGARGRLIQTGDAAYMQTPGEEVAPGKTWDKITEAHEPYNLMFINAVTSQAMTMVNSHRVHALLAAQGQASGPVFDGGLVHSRSSARRRRTSSGSMTWDGRRCSG